MFRLVIFALAVVGLAAILRNLFGGNRRPADLKCADCIHCRKLFRDGVLCGFRELEVFKNPAHIEMCSDHTVRG